MSKRTSTGGLCALAGQVSVIADDQQYQTCNQYGQNQQPDDPQTVLFHPHGGVLTFEDASGSLSLMLHAPQAASTWGKGCPTSTP